MKHIDIVFDGLPDREGPRFIEVEDDQRRSIKIGEWMKRAEDGHYVLRLTSEVLNYSLSEVLGSEIIDKMYGAGAYELALRLIGELAPNTRRDEWWATMGPYEIIARAFHSEAPLRQPAPAGADPELTGDRLRRLVVDIEAAVGRHGAGATPLGAAVTKLAEDAYQKDGSNASDIAQAGEDRHKQLPRNSDDGSVG